MSTKFHPGQRIRLLDEDYTFVEHPNAPGMPFSIEGGRAFVYQVKDGNKSSYALKVFKKKFRNSRLTECSQHLHRVEKLEGFKAAVRQVVEPSDPVVSKYPDLEYAVLMPWVSGRTWAELLLQGASKGPLYNKSGGVQVCRDFLAVMSNLEDERIAHTDISGGNVMFQLDTPDTELLDLEDLYMPNIKAPIAKTIGTPNYQHPGGKHTWCSAGDRYATAVLASEVLLLSDASKARYASDIGYFGGNRNSPEARQRFDEAQQWFQREAPQFGEALDSAWKADSLGKCPRIAHLREALDRVPAGGLVRVFTPEVPEAPVVEWEPQPSTGPGQASVEWVPTSETDVPPSLDWRPAPALKPSRRALWVAIVLAILLTLLLLAYKADGCDATQSFIPKRDHQHTICFTAPRGSVKEHRYPDCYSRQAIALMDLCRLNGRPGTVCQAIAKIPVSRGLIAELCSLRWQATRKFSCGTRPQASRCTA